MNLCELCGLYHKPELSCVAYKTPVISIPHMSCPECGDTLGWQDLDEIRIVIRHSGLPPNKWEDVDTAWDGVFTTYGTQKRQPVVPSNYSPQHLSFDVNAIAKAPRANSQVVGLATPIVGLKGITQTKDGALEAAIKVCSRIDEEIIRPKAQFTRYI